MQSFSRRLGLALVVTLALCASLFRLADAAPAPDQHHGMLVGTVMSQQGFRVPGARVVLVDPMTGILDWMHTPKDGTFRFRNLPPGQYGVLAWSPRFGKVVLPAFVGKGRATEVRLDIKTPY